VGPSLLFQAFVYLTAAVISVPVARRLGLGSVLGYLLAGVLIGPALLGLVGDSADVMHFAEFGVVMMLFLIGLELRPARLWRLRGPILGLGGLQVVLTAAAIAALTLPLGATPQIAVAIGLVLALSSTAIVLQTLEERGLLKSDAGQSSFAVLLFQDIAVIPMLAVFPLLAASQARAVGGTPGHGAGAGGDGHGADSHGGGPLVEQLPDWAQPLAVLGAVAAIVIGGRFLTRPAFRYIAGSGLREIFTAAALLLVVAVTLGMQLVGLSPALGSFLAGVVLAESEYRHELEADIEPFKGLLLGLFFTSVGAGLDFGLIAAQPLAIGGAVLALLVLKFLLLFVLGRIFRLRNSQALQFAFALPQAGEFGFVLVAFAAQGALFSADLASFLLAVIAVSMLVTPLLMIVDQRLVQPRFRGAGGVPRDEEQDRAAVEAATQEPVILAGLGRFGVTVLRFLKANGVNATVLETDPAQLELVAKFGHHGFFGDAGRVDVLHAAGAHRARLLIVAINEREHITAVVQTARKHFPNLKVFARARSMDHAYELLGAGVDAVERETFGSAVELGVAALRALGFRGHQVTRASREFRRHEQRVMRELLELVGDEQAYVERARLRTEELTRLLTTDQRVGQRARDSAFDVSSRTQEARREGPEGESAAAGPAGD
jgi:monovalent cation:proton antiporter-2 (CPA2) family protein